MSIRAQFVALLGRLMGSDGRGHGGSYHPAGAATFGPVAIASQRRAPDGSQQLAARRTQLIEEARRLRNLQRNREASLIEAQVRALTHQILRGR